MIQTEFYRTREDGVNLYRTFSDADMMIEQEQTGAIYSEAVDVEGAAYTYTETAEPIEDDIEDAEALDILLGRDAHEET